MKELSALNETFQDQIPPHSPALARSVPKNEQPPSPEHRGKKENDVENKSLTTTATRVKREIAAWKTDSAQRLYCAGLKDLRCKKNKHNANRVCAVKTLKVQRKQNPKEAILNAKVFPKQ